MYAEVRVHQISANRLLSAVFILMEDKVISPLGRCGRTGLFANSTHFPVRLIVYHYITDNRYCKINIYLSTSK